MKFIYFKGGEKYEFINSNRSSNRSFHWYWSWSRIGIATGKATESVARQPEASGKIQTMLLLGAALAEATAIYGLIIAFMIIGKI